MPKRGSLVVLLQARVGARKGGHVLAFVVAWDTARRVLADEWPDDGITAQVEAYASWWNLPVRTAWDELQRFRAALPEFSDPGALLAVAEPAWNRRKGARGLGAVALPA